MNTPASSPAARLQRLAGYLEQDPGNAALLADACETAIACGQHAQAEAYIGKAMELSLDTGEWSFRRARLCMARRELDEAARLLQELGAVLGDQPVLAHDLAYVRLLQGDAAQAQGVLQRWTQDPQALGAMPAELRAAVQVLWLRVSHRLQRLDEAAEWVQGQRSAGTLEPAASGVASLIALDLDDLPAARALADAALAVDRGQVEALVARGTIALAEGDAAQATQWLQAALRLNPQDGRTLSALGFASLLARDFSAARSLLERSVLSMPDHVETWHALGWARLLQSDKEGAIAAFESALRLEPDSAETHGGLALLLVLTGQRQRAEEHMAAADRADPDGPGSRWARAVLSGGAGEPALLEEMLRDLLSQWRPRP